MLSLLSRELKLDLFDYLARIVRLSVLSLLSRELKHHHETAPMISFSALSVEP